MVHKIEIVLCVFSLLVAIASVIYIRYLQCEVSKSNRKPTAIKEQQYLAEFKPDASPQVCAVAFIGLLEIGYILIHTLKNKGNFYNDKNQSDLYRKSLTQDTVNLLFSVEGINGWDLF